MFKGLFKKKPAPQPADVEPQSTDVNPQPADAEPQPVDAETQPADTTPELTEVNAQLIEDITPQLAAINPQPAEATPQAAQVTPQPADTNPPPAPIRSKGFFQKISSAISGRKIDEELLEELEEQLIMGDVSIDTTQYLIEKLREASRRGEISADQEVQDALKAQVVDLLGGEAAPLQFAESGLTVWLIVGVNGVGKTTTIGKVANRLRKQGHKPLLIAGDTFRAAAIEQLQEWGRRSGCEVVAQQQGADPAAVVYDGLAAAKSRGCDIVIVDTAGRLHTKSNLMNELAKIARIVERETGRPPQETLLVLDASTGQNGLTQARAFTGSAPLSGLILTKWDGTAKGGIILTITHESELPVKLIGFGETMNDISEFDAKEWAHTMFSEN